MLSAISFDLNRENKINITNFKQEKLKTIKQNIEPNLQDTNTIKNHNLNFKFLTFKGNMNKLQAISPNVSDYAETTITEMRKFFQNFPLYSQNKKSYAKLFSIIISSIKTNHPVLNEQEINAFNKALFALSNTLKQMQDKEFNKLEITQTFSKEKLIETTLEKIKNLPETEKRKIYNCFNFELTNNPTTQTSFTLEGYPNLINTEEKLKKIQNPETKKAVQELIPHIDESLNNNPIKSNHKIIETQLNELINALPELRPLIGKKAHKTHIFDIFKHSLKVMQKISQDKNFENLNDSDKKIILTSSLLHDITKKEGIVDPMHAKEGALDAYFIASKFNFSEKEEFKLYKLIETHDWLRYPTNMTNEEQITQKLKDIALDLSYDNLLAMSTIFTHADLRAVRTDDSIHDMVNVIIPSSTKEIKKFSHGEATDIFANRIKKYISELKKNNMFYQ